MCLMMLLSLISALTIKESGIEARSVENVLYVKIPIWASAEELSSMKLQILNTEDNAIIESRFPITLEEGQKMYEFPVSSSKLPSKDNLVWHRLRYELDTEGAKKEGIVSISEILKVMGIVFTGSDVINAKTKASFTIIAQLVNKPIPVSFADVNIRVLKKDEEIIKKKGKTNNKGVFVFDLELPEGDYQLKARIASGYGIEEIERNLKVKTSYSLYLTSDKPIYQPNQVIHTRCLALDKFSRKPAGNIKAKIELFDPKNNRIFKKELTTNQFGVFASDFQLADEVNFGDYRVLATLLDETSEKTVNVSKYVLPKFKIDFKTDKEFYHPNEVVKGDIEARYIFDKPTTSAQVEITASKFDVNWEEFTKVTGKTDKDGKFSFKVNLPAYFVGVEFEKGKARVKFDIKITDEAKHEENATKSVVITKDDILLEIVPENPTPVLYVDNPFYFIAFYPDGKPAKADIRITAKKGKIKKWLLTTDDLGLAETSIISDKGEIEFTAEVTDNKGETSKREYKSKGEKEEFVYLQPLRRVFEVGEDAEFAVFASKGIKRAFLDVLKQDQVILSKTIEIEQNKGRISLPLTSEIDGLILINLYTITPKGFILRDYKNIYVNPVKDLAIDVEPDKKEYKPGEDASIKFTVRNKEDKPVISCLGVSIVDEAVFAKVEMQPGLEKVYFLLEKQLQEPKYEIHGFSFPEMIDIEPKKLEYNELEMKERASKVLFAGLAPRLPRLSEVNKVSGVKQNWEGQINYRYRIRLAKDAEKISDSIKTYLNKNIKLPINERLNKHFIDPWGNFYVVEFTKDSILNTVGIKTSGPDKKWNTPDDLSKSINLTPRSIGRFVAKPDPKKKYGSIGGKIVDAVANVPLNGVNVVIEGTEIGSATDKKGEYLIINVPVGTYSIIASYIGYEPVVTKNVLVLQNQLTTFNLKLNATVLEIGKPIEVTAERQVYIRTATATTHVSMEGFNLTVQKEPRVREYFPETFLFEPSLITDENGNGEINCLMPDNITTWRISTSASSKGGELGSKTSPLKVFQDFFIDLDLPVSLTQNDEVSIPVAVYNYTKETKTITAKIVEEEWFSLLDKSEKEIEIKAEGIGVVYFTIKAEKLGKNNLTVKAYAGEFSDAIKREIEVIPYGKKHEEIVSDRLTRDIMKTVSIPEYTVTGSQKLIMKFYPGVLSQLSEGLEGLLRMPSGCFEQTSSIAYPNILVLSYLRKARKTSPELEMRSLEYISIGYQRLISFESPGGGFEWFGRAPANKILSAYGLMEFYDMQRVFEIDEKILTRTTNWLISQQEKNGSWKPDVRYAHQEAWGKIQTAEILPTAYISWALLEAGYKEAALEKAITFIKENLNAAKDPYSLAIIANALVLYDKNDPATKEAITRLLEMKIEEGNKVYWESDIPSFTFSRGKGASIETSSLACYALIRYGAYFDVIQKVINFLISAKDPNGGWSSTQGTVLALKAILASTEIAGEETEATVKLILNGKEMNSFEIDKTTADVTRIVDLGKPQIGENNLRIEFRGKGPLLYDMVTEYYIPWEKEKEIIEPLAITLNYDKKKLTTKDILKADVKVKNNTKFGLQMTIVDLGIPPGFQLITTDIDDLVEKKVIDKYNLTPRQVILYFDKIETGKEIAFSYRLKAKYPLKVMSPVSTAYDYYNPDVTGTVRPVKLEVGF